MRRVREGCRRPSHQSRQPTLHARTTPGISILLLPLLSLPPVCKWLFYCLSVPFSVFFLRSQKRDAYEYYQFRLLVPGFYLGKTLQLFIVIGDFQRNLYSVFHGHITPSLLRTRLYYAHVLHRLSRLLSPASESAQSHGHDSPRPRGKIVPVSLLDCTAWTSYRRQPTHQCESSRTRQAHIITKVSQPDILPERLDYGPVPASVYSNIETRRMAVPY